MAEYIKCEADSFKYYVVRNKETGLYFRGKGVNKWGKYYNQASVYRFKKLAENAAEEETRRGNPTEVVEIRIAEATADVVEVVHSEWIGRRFNWTNDYPILEESHYLKCNLCGHKHFFYMYDFFNQLHKCSTSDVPITIPNYCANCGAKMDGDKNG